MSETNMSKEVKFEYPKADSFNIGPRKEDVETYKKIARENLERSKEIQDDKASSIIPGKIQKIIAKLRRPVSEVIGLGGVALLAACKGAPAVVEVEEKEEEKPMVEAPSETIMEGTKKETSPVKREEVEQVNAPEIPGLSFNQETKKYINEAGVEVGIWVKDALEINGKMQPAIGLKPEIIRDVINENKEKGIFEFPWFFNPQENKGIKIVELISINGGYKYIGMKYTEPINLYAPSDCVYAYKFKYIPQEDDPSPYSSQDFSGIYFSTGFEAKNRDGEVVPVDYEIETISWEPSVTLGQSFLSGPWAIQPFLEENRIGRFIGRLLPTNPNYSFLDFRNRADWYENPDQCQASLWMNVFSDRLDVKSDLDRILRLGEGENRVTVFVWPGNQKAVPEETN